MTKKITKETGGTSHSSVCTTVPSPQIISVSFFLMGGDSCTQAIYKTYETKGFYWGVGGSLSPDKCDVHSGKIMIWEHHC